MKIKHQIKTHNENAFQIGTRIGLGLRVDSEPLPVWWKMEYAKSKVLDCKWLVNVVLIRLGIDFGRNLLFWRIWGRLRSGSAFWQWWSTTLVSTKMDFSHSKFLGLEWCKSHIGQIQTPNGRYTESKGLRSNLADEFVKKSAGVSMMRTLLPFYGQHLTYQLNMM